MLRNPYFRHMEETEHIRDAVHIVWKHRKDIIKWSLISLILSALLSLLLKNYYQATTTFYPASPDLSKPNSIFGNAAKELEFYGSNQDLDRLLTICNSNELKDQLIHEFGLYAHYDIDSSKALAHYKIRKKMQKLFAVTKTKYDAIELSIEDHDRVLAATMTNRARDLINISSHKLIADRLNEVTQTYAVSIEQMQNKLNLLNDSLSTLRKKYPIYNIEAQTETMSNIATQVTSDLAGEQARYDVLKSNHAPKDTLLYLMAKIKGLQTQLKSIFGSDLTAFNFSSFNEGASKISAVTQAVERMQAQINDDKTRYQQTLSMAQAGAHAIITVNAAEVPNYKSRPQRSVLVLGVTLLSAMAMCAYYLIKQMNA